MSRLPTITYIHRNQLNEATTANVKRYLRTKYKHYLARGSKPAIKPFGILTEVSNIEWGRMLASTEE